MAETVLVTGEAGFIGFHVAKRLLDEGYKIYGIDNLSDYYDVALKLSRLRILYKYKDYAHLRWSITSSNLVNELFKQIKFDHVVHLAGMVGGKYSMQDPMAYVRANVEGMSVIMTAAANSGVKSFVYASSCSVYGECDRTPWSESLDGLRPISPYAATKLACEIMAFSFFKAMKLPSIGLRYFTVYGPWGRPDMSIFKFTDAISNEKPIELVLDVQRDYTYIDDAVEVTVRAMRSDNKECRIINVGCGRPTSLMTAVTILEDKIGKRANVQLVKREPWDVPFTKASTATLTRTLQFKPETKIEQGLEKFVEWFVEYCPKR